MKSLALNGQQLPEKIKINKYQSYEITSVTGKKILPYTSLSFNPML
jgi:hypothetical protein